MRILFLLAIILTFYVATTEISSAQVPVIDLWGDINTTYINNTTKSILGTDKQISKNTNDILDTDKKILDTVKKTLDAITGDRKQDTKTQTAAAPSGNEDFANIDKALDALKDASDGIKVQYEKRVTTDNKANKDPLIEKVSRTTTDMSSFIKATLDALKIRKTNYYAVSQNIGTTQDIKGSIDQNSQIQVQNGLLLNELAGINNNILASNQSDTRNRTANVYGSMNAMSYNDN